MSIIPKSIWLSTFRSPLADIPIETDRVCQQSITVLKKGIVALKPGVLHEIAVEVDPSKVSAVRWKFSSNSFMKFEMNFFRMIGSGNAVINSSSIVPLTEVKVADGIVESIEKGCILFRWTAKDVTGSSWNFWNCGNTTEFEYELETVPRPQELLATAEIAMYTR